MVTKLLLDVDTGVDDAMAIALASRLSTHEIVALTTVAGNVPVDFATVNTRRVATWLGIDAPIYAGMSEPLVRPLWTAREHHGHDGLGGWQVPAEPRPLQSETAPEAIVRLAREHQGNIDFAFVGPLTNLAVAVKLEPRIVEWVNRLTIMGGAFFKPGNVTEHAEFNIFVDPEAADAVACAGFDTTWIGLDVTHQTTLTPDDRAALESADDPAAILVREVTRRTLVELGRPASNLHDPLAIAVVSNPTVVESVDGEVTIDIGEFRRGMTSVAALHDGSGRRARVARAVDQHAFDAQFSRVAPRASWKSTIGT